MSRLVLVSFADKRYRNSLKRLDEQTKDFPFDERYFLTQENCLTKEYWRSLKPWLYRRGYGYWNWKASIVKDYLERLDYGDLLFWSDAGIYWNYTEKSKIRFDEYIQLLYGDNDILTFSQQMIEKEWTKGDVLEVLDVYDDEKIINSNQLWAGLFLLKKTERTMELVDSWVKLNDLKKELVTDKRSIKPNKEGFKEHRHDQSIFSILVKKYLHIEIPWLETQTENDDWNQLGDYPIQARRLKEMDRPKSEVLRNKLLMPWRLVLNVYFRYIRDYYFVGMHYPW